MCIYIYIYIYIYIFMYIYIYTCVSLFIGISNSYLSIYIYIYIHIPVLYQIHHGISDSDLLDLRPGDIFIVLILHQDLQQRILHQPAHEVHGVRLEIYKVMTPRDLLVYKNPINSYMDFCTYIYIYTIYV